ncbi:alpha-(1,6)-fucosyltransferase-like [Strongylocentrotus purpuratus]|uniref:GT23 domain-containing protein n=1 Tax=Strongylocentrotus purpuratus TaxID=7668 RepID=A0A7M7NUZ7_STRPU|nr:alpha-(1,6)-fucosyltransferase-like [Strongylocentrotus purpuratus]
MDKLYKLMLSMTTALLIVSFIVLSQSPSSNQHSKPSEQSSRSTELHNDSLQNKDIKKHAQEQKYIMSDDNTPSRGDGSSSWKQNESKKLSNLIQQRLHFIQNPPDCSKAKKIVCNFKVRCGFGCQTHHLSFCMIMAYGTGRTLILESKGWDYAKEGWEKFFRPLSENCLDRKGETTGKWTTPDKNKNIQVVVLPVVHRLSQDLRPDFLPFAIPEDISERLERVHGNPAVWWIGQIMTYILRPQPQLQEFMDNETAALGFTHPIVGIQVRRTDKLRKEAKFHAIEEYMVYAEEFYVELEKRQEVPVRRIFLATDEARLLEEAKKKYPGYVFVSDNNISQSAKVSTRLSEESFMGIIVDVYLLARSDFLVCTCSSNVCRLAYEMMQHNYVDASTKVRSLDREYFFHGQTPNSLGKRVKMPMYEGAENVPL